VPVGSKAVSFSASNSSVVPVDVGEAIAVYCRGDHRRNTAIGD
jgi:hypothetical protein